MKLRTQLRVVCVFGSCVVLRKRVPRKRVVRGFGLRSFENVCFGFVVLRCFENVCLENVCFVRCAWFVVRGSWFVVNVRLTYDAHASSRVCMLAQLAELRA